MAAITLAPTPAKSGLGLGWWVDLQDKMATLAGVFTDSTSNGTTANTIAELNTFITAVIAANSDVV